MKVYIVTTYDGLVSVYEHMDTAIDENIPCTMPVRSKYRGNLAVKGFIKDEETGTTIEAHHVITTTPRTAEAS